MQAIKVTFGTDTNGDARYIASCDARRLKVYPFDGLDTDIARKSAAQALADLLKWGRVEEAGSIDKGKVYIYKLKDFPDNNPARQNLIGHTYDVSTNDGWRPLWNWGYDESLKTIYLAGRPMFELKQGLGLHYESDGTLLAKYIVELLNGNR